MNAVDFGVSPILSAKNTAVDDLTLAVPEGSVHGFIGSYASSQTTTVRMIVNIFCRMNPFDHVSIREHLHESRLGLGIDLLASVVYPLEILCGKSLGRR